MTMLDAMALSGTACVGDRFLSVAENRIAPSRAKAQMKRDEAVTQAVPQTSARSIRGQ